MHWISRTYICSWQSFQSIGHSGVLQFLLHTLLSVREWQWSLEEWKSIDENEKRRCSIETQIRGREKEKWAGNVQMRAGTGRSHTVWTIIKASCIITLMVTVSITISISTVIVFWTMPKWVRSVDVRITIVTTIIIAGICETRNLHREGVMRERDVWVCV